MTQRTGSVTARETDCRASRSNGSKVSSSGSSTRKPQASKFEIGHQQQFGDKWFRIQPSTRNNCGKEWAEVKEAKVVQQPAPQYHAWNTNSSFMPILPTPIPRVTLSAAVSTPTLVCDVDGDCVMRDAQGNLLGTPCPVAGCNAQHFQHPHYPPPKYGR